MIVWYLSYDVASGSKITPCNKIDIEDIYFFEVNTKYISSSVLKTLEFFMSAHEMKYIWHLLKTVNFLFILYFLEDLQLIILLTMLQAESQQCNL